MKMSMKRFVWGVVAVGVIGGLASVGGFVVGLRWPLEGLEERLGLRTHRFAVDWRPLARTELPRYENLRLQIGDTLYLFGGFHRIRPGTFEPDATARVLPPEIAPDKT